MAKRPHAAHRLLTARRAQGRGIRSLWLPKLTSNSTASFSYIASAVELRKRTSFIVPKKQLRSSFPGPALPPHWRLSALETVRAADPGARGRSSVLAEIFADPEAFETLRVELVEGLARMIEHGKAEVPFAIDQIAQICATLAGVANIADFLDDLDAAERVLTAASCLRAQQLALLFIGVFDRGRRQLILPGIGRRIIGVLSCTVALIIVFVR